MIQRETSFAVETPESSDEIVLEYNPDEASSDVSDSTESPKKRSRGKGKNWVDDGENFATSDAVVIDADVLCSQLYCRCDTIFYFFGKPRVQNPEYHFFWMLPSYTFENFSAAFKSLDLESVFLEMNHNKR